MKFTYFDIYYAGAWTKLKLFIFGKLLLYGKNMIKYLYSYTAGKKYGQFKHKVFPFGFS